MSNILHIAAAALLVGGLAACSNVSTGEISNSASATGGSVISIGSAGIAGLPAGTAYSEAAIEAALPGYDASPITIATAEREQAALALFKDGLQTIQILQGSGGKIGQVFGVSDRVRGPNGERIGMTFTEARETRGACRTGTGNWRGMPLCEAKGAPNITLAFAIPGYLATDALPDDATLSTATLQRIIWTPGPL